MTIESLIYDVIILFCAGRIASLAVGDFDSGILFDTLFGLGGLLLARHLIPIFNISLGLSGYTEMAVMSFIGALVLFTLRSLLKGKRRVVRRSRIRIVRSYTGSR